MKKSMLFIIAAAAMMTVLACCEKPDPIVPPGPDPDPEEKVEVVDSGKDATVSVTAIPDGGGTEFAYNAWVKVKTTKGSKASEETISAKIAASIPNVKKEIVVEEWEEVGDPKVEMFVMKGDQKSEGSIAVTDSVLVCRIELAGYRVECNMAFGVPAYSNGSLRHDMPYYRFEGVSVGDVERKSAESVERDGRAYARQILSWPINVVFNGTAYKSTAEFIILGPGKSDGDKYVLSSKVLNKTVTKATAGYQVDFDVENTWSNGEKDTKSYSDFAGVDAGTSEFAEDIVVSNKSDVNFEIKKCSLIETVNSDCKEDVEGVKKYTYKNIIALDLGYFSINVPFYHQNLQFNNGVLVEWLTDFAYDLSAAKVVEVKWYQQSSKWYVLDVKVAIPAGELDVVGTVRCNVVIKT